MQFFKAHLEGYDVSNFNDENFKNRVNEILNLNKGLKNFLKKHGIEETNIF